MAGSVKARVVVAALALLIVGCTSDATKTAAPTNPLLPASPPSSITATSTEVQPVTPVSVGASVAGATTAATVSPDRTSARPTDPASTTTTKPAPPTTTIPLVTKGAVVMVANASNVDGAAGRLSEQLRELGFTVQKPTTASGVEHDLDKTKVYVRNGSEKVARSVAHVLGDVPIAYMPTPISIRGGPAQLGKATVVVMLGADIADKGLPT